MQEFLPYIRRIASRMLYSQKQSIYVIFISYLKTTNRIFRSFCLQWKTYKILVTQVATQMIYSGNAIASPYIGCGVASVVKRRNCLGCNLCARTSGSEEENDHRYSSYG